MIDTDVRIRAQAQSLQRVEVLLARAESLRDIVAIEAQLTQRQAELDSLKARQAYLADQTSMSTITVYIERKAEARAEKKAEDDSGFLAGLGNGWGGMTAFLTGLATVVGAAAAVRGPGAGAGRSRPGCWCAARLAPPAAGRRALVRSGRTARTRSAA